MKAKVGDTVVVEGNRVGEHRRVGVIVGVPHDDGSPPYTVRWEGDHREALLFPGPDTHLASQPAQPRPTVKHWTVDINITESADHCHTDARAALSTGAPMPLAGEGSALGLPADVGAPSIGDQLSAGRALADLARQLTNADIDTGRPGHERHS